jgi:hypothetical protein
MCPFKVGELVVGKKFSPYGYTDHTAEMIVVKTEGKSAGEDMTVRIIRQMDVLVNNILSAEQLETEYSVNSKHFEYSPRWKKLMAINDVITGGVE